MADMSLRAMDLVDFEVEVDPWQGMWGLDLPKRENDSEVIQDPWLMGGIDVPKIERKQNPPSVDDIACPTTPEHLLSTQYQNGRNPANPGSPIIFRASDYVDDYSPAHCKGRGCANGCVCLASRLSSQRKLPPQLPLLPQPLELPEWIGDMWGTDYLESLEGGSTGPAVVRNLLMAPKTPDSSSDFGAESSFGLMMVHTMDYTKGLGYHVEPEPCKKKRKVKVLDSDPRNGE